MNRILTVRQRRIAREQAAHRRGQILAIISHSVAGFMAGLITGIWLLEAIK